MKTPQNNLTLFLFYGTLLASLFGQFARFSSPVGLVSLHEIFMLAFCVLVWPLFLSRKTLRWNFLLAFIVWIVLSTIIASWQTRSLALLINGLAYAGRLNLYLGFALSLRKLLQKKALQSAQVFSALYAWLTLLAIMGIGQYLLLPDTRIFFFLGWDDHLSRAFATLFDPGYFGLLMVFGVILSLEKQRMQASITNAASLAVFLISVAISYSRASYLALIVGIIAYAVLSQTRRVLLVLPLFIMSLVLLPKDGGGAGQNLLRTQTVEMRTEVAQIHTKNLQTWEMIAGRGWYYEKVSNLHAQTLGQGKNTPQRQNSAGVDNAFLHVFLSSGVIGIVLFLTALVQLYCRSTTMYGKAFFLAVLAHSFFSLGLFYPWTMLLLAITFFLGEEPSSHQKAKNSE